MGHEKRLRISKPQRVVKGYVLVFGTWTGRKFLSLGAEIQSAI
jgi:hypothetical protein